MKRSILSLFLLSCAAHDGSVETYVENVEQEATQEPDCEVADEIQEDEERCWRELPLWLGGDR